MLLDFTVLTADGQNVFVSREDMSDWCNDKTSTVTAYRFKGSPKLLKPPSPHKITPYEFLRMPENDLVPNPWALQFQS